MFSLYSLGPLVLSPWGPCYKLNCMVVIRTLATAAIYFSLARMRLLIEGGSYYFRVVHKATQSSCQPRKQVLQHVRLYSLRIAQWAPRAGIITVHGLVCRMCQYWALSLGLSIMIVWRSRCVNLALFHFSRVSLFSGSARDIDLGIPQIFTCESDIQKINFQANQ